MPLSDTTAPCAFCLADAASEINDETGEAIGTASVMLSELNQTSRICVKCLRRFCPDHASPVDQSDCCYQCLPFEAISETKLPLIYKDDNGTEHIAKGSKIVPTGPGYKTLPAAIADMRDDELAAYIAEKAIQVHNVERQRDFLKIAHSTAKLEQGERELAASRALRGYKLPVIIPSKGIKITGKAGKNGEAVKGVVAAGGINIADFLKFAAQRAASKVSPQSTQSKAPTVTMTQTVTAKKEGEVLSPPPPPYPFKRPLQNKTPEEIAEQAHEAEIEKILEGGEEMR